MTYTMYEAMQFREVLRGFWQHIVDEEQRKDNINRVEAAANATQYLAFLEGDSYYVQRNIVELIEDTAAELPDDVTLEPEALLSDRGFAFFEQPAESIRVMVGPEPDEKVPAIMSGLSWYVVRFDDDDTPDKLVVEVYGDTGEMPVWPMFATTFPLGEPMPEPEPGEVMRGHYDDPHYGTGSENDHELARKLQRMVVTFYLFVNQQIVEAAKPRLTRQQRRLAERKNTPINDAPLVVSLRRVTRTKGDGTGSKLTMRVPTRPHWQRYHTGTNRDQVVWRLKDLYWRGPEDAPTKPVTDRVFVVRR